MKAYTIATTAIALSGALALAGCLQQDDALTDEDYDDVAVAVGSLVANPSGGELGSFQDSLDMTQSSKDANAVEGASGHEVIIRAGLTYEYFVDCLDAAGTVQSVCDAATTDSAALAVSWSGSLELPTYQGSIARTGEWTLSGLQSGTAELNGQGNFDLESHFQAIYRPVTKDLVLSYQANYNAVQIDMASRTVQSGDITYQISGSRSVTRGDVNRSGEFSLVADVSFDGAGNATLVLDGTRSYTINLSTGAVASTDAGNSTDA